MRMLGCAVAVAVVSSSSCGSNASPDSGVDAGSSVEKQYVVTSLHMPASNSAAREFAIDVDGDGNVDNQLGQITATFAQQGFDDQPSIDLAFKRGDDVTLLETSTAGSLQVLYGKKPCDAGVCEVDSTMPAALTATFDGDVVKASGTGSVEFPFAYFGAVVKLNVQRPNVRFSQQEDGGVFVGVIAGTTPAATAKATLNGAALAHFSKLILETCTGGAAPECGCASGTTARVAIDLFDAPPKDCVITLAEMNDNALISSLFAADQTVNGQPSLSLGYEFTVVPARFTGP